MFFFVFFFKVIFSCKKKKKMQKKKEKKERHVIRCFFKDENQTKLQIWQSFRKKGKKLKKFCSFTYCISRLDSQMKLWKKSGKRFREARRPFSGDFFSHISLLNSIQLVLLLALGLKRLCHFFSFSFLD